jgi:hypothetical protein
MGTMQMLRLSQMVHRKIEYITMEKLWLRSYMQTDRYGTSC